MQLSRFLAATSLLGAAALAQFQVTVPAGYANTVGNSNNTYPWARTTASMRFQQIYDSSHFTSQGITYPIVISGMKFRPYAGTATSWTGGQWTNLRVDLATSAVDYLAASATFANNLGANVQTVVNGPQVITGGTSLGAGVVVPPHVDVSLTTPYLYDPSSGDFLFDVYVDGATWTGGTVRGCDVVSGATSTALGTRIYSTAGLAATTGTIGTNHSLVCEFSYVPAAGLYPSFNADVTRGPSPLTVNFTDSSYSSDPLGVLGWAWDLDGDNVVDSTLQNPSFTYANCGSYDVTLTVVDATHGTQTITRPGYIVTDSVSADFTYQVIGPYTVLFTDTSTPAATSWAWDLNGDNVIDSTSQSTAWVYPNANPVSVSLTVTRLCSAPSTKTTSIVPVQSLSHNVAPNNGLSTGASVYMDLDVLNPSGISITSLDVAPSTANTAFTVDVWVKPGTYTGFTGAAAEWAYAGTGSSVGGSSTASASASVLFTQPLFLAPGLHGVKLRYVGVGPRYQTGTVVTTVGNADVTMTIGTSRGSTVADPWAGSDITPRLWSGVLYYGSHNLTGSAGYGAAGPGCNGSLGRPELTSNLPQLGNTMTVNVGNMAQSVGIMLTGFSSPVTDLTSFGAPGCSVRVSPDVSSLLLGAGNTAAWTFNVPNNGAFSGLILHHQALVIDPTANTLGLVMSDSAASQLGN
jgi:PKD repeat protein